MRNKKVIVFLLVAIILLIFSVNCFAASDFKEEKDGYTFYMPSNVGEVLSTIIKQYPEYSLDNYYYSVGASFFFKKLNVVFYPKDDVNYIFGDITNGDSIWFYTDTRANTTVWFECDLSSVDSANHSFNVITSTITKKDSAVGTDSSHAILTTYNPDDKYVYYVGNIPTYQGDRTTKWVNENSSFFLAPPAETLAGILEKVEMNQVLQEVVALLPLILVILVSLVGLRKALNLLFNFLRTS